MGDNPQAPWRVVSNIAGITIESTGYGGTLYMNLSRGRGRGKTTPITTTTIIII